MESNLVELTTFPDQKKAELARVKLQKHGIIALIASNEEESSSKGVTMMVKPEDHGRAKSALVEDNDSDLSSYLSENESLLHTNQQRFDSKIGGFVRSLVERFKR